MTRIPPCWKEEETDVVLETFAENIEPHLFRAIHCESSLNYKESYFAGDYVSSTHRGIIDKFLDPKKNQDIRCVVTGNSGMGKTHLIKLIRSNINSDDTKNVVVNIPKTGMSLINILKRIIHELPEDQQGEFLDKIEGQSAEKTSQEDKVKRLLAELEISISNDHVTDGFEGLNEALKNIFLDPHLRKEFFEDGEHTVNSIINHIFEDKREENSWGVNREFSIEDLPSASKYARRVGGQRNDLSKPAEDGLLAISGPAWKDKAVEVVNKNLKDAIRRSLKLEEADPGIIITKIREHLAKEKKCLILLIEDFAALQGIEKGILESLIAANKFEGKGLCQLRWAMAVTTGYVEAHFPDTVLSRLNLIVDMDGSEPASIQKMASGYLNALRWGESKLREVDQNNIPSKCDDCDHKENCHISFGQENGIGLFPFTKRAFQVMAEKTYSIDKNGILNPREFLKTVLNYVLNLCHHNLEEGSFPPYDLFKKIGGGVRISNVTEMNLNNLGDKDIERRRTLLELWSGEEEQQLVNFPIGLHKAFGISVLEGIPTLGSDREPVPEKPEDKPEQKSEYKPKQENQEKQSQKKVQPTSAQKDPHLKAIQLWSKNGEDLDQGPAAYLRGLVFESINEFIDWDVAGFVKSEYKGDKLHPFTPLSITFVRPRRETGGSKPVVELKITSESLEATALEALVKRDINNGWEFENSGDFLAALLESLKNWSDSVIKQLNNTFRGTDEWNPVWAAIELISLHQLQSGKINTNQKKEEIREILLQSDDLWKYLNLQEEADNGATPTALDKNFIDIESTMVELTKYFSSLNMMTKGSTRMENPLKNPLELANCIDNFIPNLEFSQDKIPNIDDVKADNLKKIIRLYEKIKENIHKNLAREKEEFLKWDQELIDSLGKGKEVKKLVDNLNSLLDASTLNDVGPWDMYANKLADFINENDIVIFQEAINNSDSLEKDNPMLSLVKISSIKKQKYKIEELISTAENIYNSFSSFIDPDDETDDTSDNISNSRENIKSSLKNITKKLDKIKCLNELKK